MSTATITNKGNALQVNTDTSKIFIRENRYENDEYVNNSGYDPITLVAGTLMGRVAATGVLVPFNAAASDGSQHVVGVLACDLIIDSGDTVEAAICIKGDVAKEKIVFTHPGDAFETVVSGRRVIDKIKSDTAGVIPVSATELAGYDNQI